MGIGNALAVNQIVWIYLEESDVIVVTKFGSGVGVVDNDDEVLK